MEKDQMGMTARDIGKIPAGAYDWYIYLLEDGLSDPIRDDLARNFEHLGNLIGADGLIVRGYDKPSFRKSVESAYSGVYEYLGDIRPPALLVSDTAPAALGDAHDPVVLVFQLRKLVKSHGSVADFLDKLMRSLADPEAMKALQGKEPAKIAERWNWLGEYIKLDLGAFGCSVNLHKVIGNLLKARGAT